MLSTKGTQKFVLCNISLKQTLCFSYISRWEGNYYNFTNMERSHLFWCLIYIFTRDRPLNLEPALVQDADYTVEKTGQLALYLGLFIASVTHKGFKTHFFTSPDSDFLIPRWSVMRKK